MPGVIFHFQIHKTTTMDVPQNSFIMITFNYFQQQNQTVLAAPFDDAPTDVISLLLCDSQQHCTEQKN